MRGTNEIRIMIFSYANGILTVNLYKAVDQEFVEAANTEMVDLANSGDLDNETIQVQVVQVGASIPASIGYVIGAACSGIATPNEVYFTTQSDQLGEVQCLF